MKKLMLMAGILTMAVAANSQIFSWGLKGGVNSSKVSFDDFGIEPSVSIKDSYLPGGSNDGELLIDLNNDGVAAEINPLALDVSANVTFEPSSYDLGYHFGAFARVKVLGIFIQPELIFSQTNTTINIKEGDEIKDGAAIISEFKNSTSNIKYTNFDIPVMVGIKLGPARFYGGPVATFRLGNKADKSASEEINEMLDSFTAVTQKATFGGQAGVGLDILKKVTLDVRYEFPLSKLGDNISLGDYTYSTDQRQSQFIASIGFIF
ncbi:MAG: PorT family protein [Salinivirgaceae bacterium]|nr:PorT family protein [Salinivirgaceae bacterium]